MHNTFLTRLSRPQIADFYAGGHWQDTTIYGYVRRHSADTPDRVAIRGTHGAVTFSELFDAAERLAGHLDTAGLHVGQRVAVWLSSRTEAAVALVTCSKLGLVMSPSLHRTHTVEEVVGFLQTMRAAAFIGEIGHGADGASADVFGLATALPMMGPVLRVPPPDATDDRLFAEIDAATAPLDSREDPDSIVYLAFTSGTTGTPKGVLHSDNTLLANARALATDWQIDADSVVYSFSPVSHNLGFGSMVMSLMAGAEFVVHDVPRGASLSERLRSTGATFVVGVPTHAIDLVAELDAGADPVTTVRGFRLSGASGSRDVVSSLLGHGILPQSGYGMTEGGSHHYTLPTDDIRTVTETSGRACSGFEVRVFDPQDPTRALGTGEEGHIGCRGASLMLGYYDDQAGTEDAFNADGWFMTGDLGWLDEAGYIRVTGRIKDVIIRGGHNIHPAHIEDLAMRHADVAVAAAIPVADERLGERVCLVIATRNGGTVEPAELMSHLAAEGLSRFDMPEFVARVDALPLTASGKILKRALIDALAEGSLLAEPVS
ncbi:MAG TPA: class I adenylate-forming enzyme family protein [Acidimicrobiia bacterium]|nr:class I adenylate-forming enzyme family protein [Acidimicrobiia bacterium]